MNLRLLSLLFGLFVLGGFVAGGRGVENISLVSQRQAAAARTPSPAPAAGPHDQLANASSEPPPPIQPAGQTAVAEAASPSGRLTILLMGIDQRPDEAADGSDPGRTDSMVLLSVDFDAHTAAIVSIPRDSYVTIPGYGDDRVNAAYTYAEIDQPGTGPALAMKTVGQIFGVPVDRYALVDVHSTESAIDAVGGVWIDNPYRLVDTEYPTDDYNVKTIDIAAGLQLMDGETAVEYARTRHPDSDYGRQTRQQQVLLAIRDRALQMDVIPKLPTLLPTLFQLIHTNLAPTEVLQLANFGRDLQKDRDIIEIPPDPSLTPAYTGPGGASYIQLTSGFISQVHLLITDPRVAQEKATISVLNAGAPSGSGSSVATLLGNAGLRVSSVDTTQPLPATRIEATPDAQSTAQAVAKSLGLPDSVISTAPSGDHALQVLLGPDLRLAAGP